MKFEIHGTGIDGVEDSVVIEGSTITECQEKAKEATDSRGWTDCWSTQLTD